MALSMRRFAREVFRALRRGVSTGSGKEGTIVTSLGETTHIPAPEVHRPKVSPLTELGSKKETEDEAEEVPTEPMTSLGLQAEKETAESETTEDVITWLGEKPAGLEALRSEKSEAERQRAARKDGSFPAVESLPFDAVPKFVSLTRPKKLKEPLDLDDALRRVLEEAEAGRDHRIRLDLRLFVDPRKSDQFVRGLTTLPHGTGQAPRIAVFAEGSVAQAAREAEVDLVGGPELIQEILDSNGAAVEKIDKCLATPAMMAAGMSKLGRILGPRGLMPSPKMGTLTENVVEAVAKLRQGQIEFRIDRTGALHTRIGRVSFGAEKLRENVVVFGTDVAQARPAAFRQKPVTEFFQRLVLSTTHGRGFPVAIPSFAALLQSES